jgi:hypothetical protein
MASSASKTGAAAVEVAQAENAAMAASVENLIAVDRSQDQN